MELMDQLLPSIKLYLLGAPRLERNGALVTIDRRKAVALLAYLALTGQTHLRDAIATLLWPDSGQSHARANLRHTLVMLKQALQDDTLTIAWDNVALKQEAALWVDVLHFQALLMACRSHSHAPDDVCAVCLPLLTEAVALPAEQFMAGFSLADSPDFDDWQRAQQQQLMQALSDALDRLVGYFTQTGDYKHAVAYAQRRLGLDSLDEAAQRQLIQLYVWSGQQGLALRQFEQCTNILSQELGVAPSAETARLVQTIRKGHASAPDAGLSGADSLQQPPAIEAERRPAVTPRHNLPMRQQPLIGRDQDLRAVKALLQRATVNLVTLIGPGGVGKTQLSIQLASLLLEHFADGVFFVSLAPLREAEQVISALAQTWHLPSQGDRPLLERLQTYLRHKQMLLILDNFEHLMAAAPAVSALLANCAHLRIVVTSRELLNVQGEHLYPVSPLSLPEHGQQPTVAAVAKATAVQLFVQRAQATIPGFVLDEANAADIAHICMHLDGLPLAIELVAARIRLLSPRALRQRLLGAASSSFELLQSGARDAPLRHRTLKDAIAWSYDLLTAAEQWLFRRLAVFVGGCTLEAVERVSEVGRQAGIGSVLDLLASLVNKSLVQQVVQPDGESRFLLLEMIREFGLEKTQATGDFAAVTRAHAETFTTFAETAAPALTGPDHLAWIARLNADHDNCRAALRWAISHQQAELAMRLSGALWSYWLDRGFYGEGRHFLTTILQLEGAGSRTPLRARALIGLGALIWRQSNSTSARMYQEEAVAIYRERADECGLATALEHLVETSRDIDMDTVYAVEAEVLYEKLNDHLGMARMRQEFGYIKYAEGDYRAAQATFEQIIAIYDAQHYEAGLGFSMLNLGRALFQQQDFTRANQHFAEALLRAQARGDQELVAEVLYYMGRIAYYQAEYAPARNLFEESLRIGRELGIDDAKIAFRLAFLGDVALAQGDAAAASTLLRESLTLIYQADTAFETYAVALILAHFAGLATTLGEHRRAVQLIAAARSLYQTLPFHMLPNDQILFDAPLATARRSLSPKQFDQAWAAGEQMTMDEAVVLALAE